MGKSRAFGVLPLLIGAGLTLASAGASSQRAQPAPSPDCEAAKRANKWCAAGNVGYVASVPIRSRFLYEALDAHGHDVDPAAMTCAVCRKAVASHGFCAAHRMGYVGGHAFLSPLTYYLARSHPVDPARITCPVCRQNTLGIGWCDAHHVGIAGTFALDDRQEFEEMQKAYAILLAAIETSARCERCAAAMVADGYCAIHRIKYKDGRAAPAS